MGKIRRSKTATSGQRDPSIEAVLNGDTIVASDAYPDCDNTPLSESGLQWRRENRAAIECYNEWIAEHGLPLEEFRRF